MPRQETSADRRAKRLASFAGAIVLAAAALAFPAPAAETQYTPTKDRIHPDEREAIETLLEQKASIAVNEDGRMLTFSPSAEHPLAPGDLRLLDGKPRLWAISFSKATDKTLAALATITLPRLESIGLTGTNITDDTVRHFTRFPTLSGLNMERTHITNRGLEVLGKLPNLYLLRLSGTVITDEGLKPLAAAPKLGWLELEDTAITDKGLAHIGQMKQLHTLYLRGTKISNDGLTQLRNLSNLRALALDRTAITDEGLVALAEFPGLQGIEHLYLSQTRVADAGMKYLDSLANLRGVALDGTRVTKAMVAKIKARPTVYWITGGR